MGAMGVGQFARECFARALRRSASTVDAVVLVFTIGVGFCGWLLGAEIIVNAPWWLTLLAIFGAVVVVRIICAPYWIYRDAAAERDELRAELDERTRRRTALNALAERMVYASSVLFRWPVQSNDDIPKWDEAIAAWREQVKKIVADNFSEAEAIAIDRVTSVPAADFGGKTPLHNNRLMFTHERIDRIRAFIEKRS
jgi:hypothetical protein